MSESATPSAVEPGTQSGHDLRTDVLVVGGGNAALCAALSARENGARVLVLEAAPRAERGGNTAYTAGAMRVTYDGVEEIRELVPELSPSQLAMTDFGVYRQEDFFEDMARVTEYRADPDLVERLVTDSRPTLLWMRRQGVRFAPIYGRQAFNVDGRFRFWGGLTLEAEGGGPGLLEALHAACTDQDVDVLYGHRATDLLVEGRRVVGVRAKRGDGWVNIHARSVVLATGGFQASAEWRSRYLGPGWDLAKVRGSRFNVGDGIRMALDIGASSMGNWSGCHAVAWDLNAPEFGTLAVGDGFQKHSYPWGLMINREGRRFVDEGADFRNYTYARYGREILKQSGQMAWQVFDAKVAHLLRDEYRIREVTVVRGDTMRELAGRMEGVDVEAFIRTVEDFNNAVSVGTDFNPNVRDGRDATGIDVPKSNWANRLDTPPYEAYAVTCGITFTFGGLRVDPTSAQVIDTDGGPVGGLFACGEMVGGIFYFNYPGGSGLTSGAVFGRIAGEAAAQGNHSGGGVAYDGQSIVRSMPLGLSPASTPQGRRRMMRPTIEIHERVALDASRERAWKVLTDPRTVVSCVPGAEILEVDDDGTIQGAITVSLGPAATRFEGTVTQTFDEEQRSGRLAGKGSDGRGRTRAAVETTFRLEELAEPGRCELVIESSLLVSGALAGFAKTGGAPLARRLLHEFGQNLAVVAAPVDAGADVKDHDRPQLRGFSFLVRAIWDAIRRALGRGPKDTHRRSSR